MSEASFRAAETLRKLRNRRSCVSRAYYAAFAAVTSEVRKRTTAFPRGYEHPPHPQIGSYVKRHLTRFGKKDRSHIRDALSRLRSARLIADYRQNPDPDEALMRSAVLDARFVLKKLELI
jgi:uncharacterized protein (UPF0332 family)